jgi:hypothetical protein
MLMATNASILAAFERMWQHISVALSQKTDIDHLHDDRYYTEGEIDTKVAELNEAIANASSQPDWNQNDETANDYIKNRPFGEIVTGGDTITWDGNIEGLDCANSDINGDMCKISDAIITLDDLQNGCQYFMNVPEYPEDSGLIPLEPYDIVDFGTALVSGNFSIAFVSEPNTVVNDWTFPSAGVYVRWTPSGYISSLTINGYTGFITETIKTIDQKYLPEPLQFGTSDIYGDTLTWDGNIEGRICVLSDIPDDSPKVGWCLMSDYVLTPDDFTNGFKDTYFFINSEEIGVIANQEDMEHHFLNDGVFWTGSGRTIGVPYDNYEFEGTLYPSKGIYFYFVIYNGELLEHGSSLTIPGFDFADATIKTIDEKYIPDSIARKSDLESVGTQLNWSNVQNKPFKTVDIDTLTWDGNVEGLECVILDQGAALYHISDIVLSPEDFTSGCIIAFDGISGSHEYERSQEDALSNFAEDNSFFEGNVYSIPYDN